MQKFSQYFDAESSVVKKPEGQGWDDPFGDGVWRSSWFYASLLIMKGFDGALYGTVASEHDLDMTVVNKFLEFFQNNCTGAKEWTLPKNPSQRFSRDQLSPLLYLMASVSAYGSTEAKSSCQEILSKLVELDRQHGALSDTHPGQIHDNMRYAIDIVCRMYGVDYLRGIRRELCKFEFSAALAINNQLAQLPWKELATTDSYSVYNALSIVSVACIKWGKDDEDVEGWRKNFRVHADKGWGPSFRVVSGRSISDAEIDAYKLAYISREQDNDIVMGQRPRNYLSGEFATISGEGPNRWLVLDYIILKSLRLLWS